MRTELTLTRANIGLEVRPVGSAPAPEIKTKRKGSLSLQDFATSPDCKAETIDTT